MEGRPVGDHAGGSVYVQIAGVGPGGNVEHVAPRRVLGGLERTVAIRLDRAGRRRDRGVFGADVIEVGADVRVGAPSCFRHQFPRSIYLLAGIADVVGGAGCRRTGVPHSADERGLREEGKLVPARPAPDMPLVVDVHRPVPVADRDADRGVVAGRRLHQLLMIALRPSSSFMASV